MNTKRYLHVDIVWDITDNIKAFTREKRGKGLRRKVAGKSRYQGNGMIFGEIKLIRKSFSLL